MEFWPGAFIDTGQQMDFESQAMLGLQNGVRIIVLLLTAEKLLAYTERGLRLWMQLESAMRD